ncbi:MAG TPA: hypothetical protein VL598_01965 [Trinickia sp.]|uniref:hypothetical protein n=1 Tax=Trinickia sp. TaxID=2571163 RepID=UPI002C929CC7|nr:hypothetical protein [Trinickia sp.]HTI16410.1 hypothetical protein [Trinickia sp.]
MNTLQVRLLSLAVFAIFCATLTYWIVTLGARSPAPPPSAAAVAPSVSLDDAATLFGGKLTPEVNRSIKLFGILALSEGAAAILSVGDEPPRAVSLGGRVGSGKLAEVRARSIILDQNGAHSEIFLPANTGGGPTIYVR